MKPQTLCIALLALGALAVGCSNSAELVEGDSLLVLNGATLIDGTGAPPRENAVIVVQGNQILRVGAVGQYRFPSDASILDLDDHHIVPGFIDTHVHVRGIDMMSTLLAFGLTTIRSTGERAGQGVPMRERLENGDLMGPRMFIADRILDDPGNELAGNRFRVETEAEILEEVRRQAALGVDYIKLYMGIPDELVGAAVEEAHALDVKVVGHLHRTSWTSAANAGIDALVHSGSEGPIWELLDGNQRDRFPWGDFKNYLLAWSETSDRVDLEGPQMNALVRSLLDNGVEVNPTLVVVESLYWGDDTALLERLEPAYAPTRTDADLGRELAGIQSVHATMESDERRMGSAQARFCPHEGNDSSFPRAWRLDNGRF